MENADYFSSLPDNIITQIFFYLTMKESLAICISCKKLMHLRNTIPHLEFKESADNSFNLLVDAKKRNLVHGIDQFLKNHDGPIQTFRLSFYPDWYSENVFSWISLLMQGGLVELDLNFLANLGVPIQLPSALLNSETLQVLKLRSCILDSPLDFSGLSSLKSLFLGDVTLSDDVMHVLLCQSRLLQNFVLENCKGFELVEVTNINNELNYLSLEYCYGPQFLSAARVRALRICTRLADVFILDPSEITNTVFLYDSLSGLSIQRAHNRTAEVLDIMNFSLDKEERLSLDDMDWEYKGVAKLELETYSHNFMELQGHSWVLRGSCVEKFVISILP